MPRTMHLLILALIVISPIPLFAHPATGIYVDTHGNIYILYRGLDRVSPSGQFTIIDENTGGHWLTVDAHNSFSALPSAYKRVVDNGTTFIYGDGAPLVIADNILYYATDGSPDLPTGALALAKFSPAGQRSLFSPALQQKLHELQDGVTGLAAGPDGSIYVATWKGLIKVSRDGSIAQAIHPIWPPDCDSDPADHNPVNAHTPLLRGLAVDSAGNVYAAATSCHLVLKINPAGQVQTALKSERPYAPTGVAVAGDEVYVLEYTNANGPRTEGWAPRVRKRDQHGAWTTVATLPPLAPNPR